MNDIDRRITDPHHDAAFLDWYRGIFGAVYIALHPFHVIDGIDPATARRPVLVIDRSSMSPEPLTMDKVREISSERTAGLAMDLQTVQTFEKQAGQVVSYEQIRKECGFKTIAQVYRALLTIIMAIRGDWADPEAAERLQAYCATKKIFLPTEDTFPPLMEHAIVAALRNGGIKEVCLSDEFDDNKEIVLTDALDVVLPWAYAGVHDFRVNKIYPEDHGLLMVVPWDNFSTVICGDAARLRRMQVDTLFEGFWADETTRPNWWQA